MSTLPPPPPPPLNEQNPSAYGSDCRAVGLAIQTLTTGQMEELMPSVFTAWYTDEVYHTHIKQSPPPHRQRTNKVKHRYDRVLHRHVKSLRHDNALA